MATPPKTNVDQMPSHKPNGDLAPGHKLGNRFKPGKSGNPGVRTIVREM